MAAVGRATVFAEDRNDPLLARLDGPDRDRTGCRVAVAAAGKADPEPDLATDRLAAWIDRHRGLQDGEGGRWARDHLDGHRAASQHVEDRCPICRLTLGNVLERQRGRRVERDLGRVRVEEVMSRVI